MVKSVAILRHDEILQLHATAVSARLSGSRTGLLAGVSADFIATLPQLATPGEQLLADLDAMNAVGQLPDGSFPLLSWLKNAQILGGTRAEAKVFNRFLTHVRSSTISANKGDEEPIATAVFPAPRGASSPDPGVDRDSSLPAYLDAATRHLSISLERAYARKRALLDAGSPVKSIDDEILDLRRRLREGGQLREGDSLGDGRYLLLSQLGSGGFASVWRAVDREQNVIVAMKVLHSSEARNAQNRERFFRGAREMMRMRHEAIVRVLLPHGEDGGFHYFVMDLLQGGDLHRAVEDRTLKNRDILPLILRIGEGLAHAHAGGLVHRDVKPGNILLGEDGAAKLTDFDLVLADHTTGGTRTGAMGTFIYGAPELLDNAKSVGAQADVYGLGMTAVFCFYGRPLPISAVRSGHVIIDGLACDDRLKPVLKRSIEWDLNVRFQDISTFCRAIRDLAPEASFTSPHFPPRKERTHFGTRHMVNPSDIPEKATRHWGGKGEVLERYPWLRGGLLVKSTVLESLAQKALKEHGAGQAVCGYLCGPQNSPYLCDELVPMRNEANKWRAVDPEIYPRTHYASWMYNEKRFHDDLTKRQGEGRPVKVVYYSVLDNDASLSNYTRATMSGGGTTRNQDGHEVSVPGDGPISPVALMVVSVRVTGVDDIKLYVWERDGFVESGFTVVS